MPLPFDAFYHSLGNERDIIYFICHPGYSLLGAWHSERNIGNLHRAYDNKLSYVITQSLTIMNRNLDLQINSSYNCLFPASYNKSGREVMNELLELAKIAGVNTDFLLPRTLTHVNTLVDINVESQGEEKSRPKIAHGQFSKGTTLQFEENCSTVIKITKDTGPEIRLINIDYLSTKQQEAVQTLMEDKAEGDSIYIIIAS